MESCEGGAGCRLDTPFWEGGCGFISQRNQRKYTHFKGRGPMKKIKQGGSLRGLNIDHMVTLIKLELYLYRNLLLGFYRLHTATLQLLLFLAPTQPLNMVYSGASVRPNGSDRPRSLGVRHSGVGGARRLGPTATSLRISDQPSPATDTVITGRESGGGGGGE